MKRWFRDSTVDEDGETTALMEFDGRWVVRQVWRIGEVRIPSSSVRDLVEDSTGHGYSFPGLLDLPFEETRFEASDEISEAEFEAAWEEAVRYRRDHPTAVKVSQMDDLDTGYVREREQRRR